MTEFTTFDQRDIVPGGLRRFRLRARRHRRGDDPPDGAGHGHDTGGLRGHPAVEFFYVQPHLITPVRHSYRLALGTTISGYGGPFGQQASLFPGTQNIPNAWFLSTDIVDKTGHSLTEQHP